MDDRKNNLEDSQSVNNLLSFPTLILDQIGDSIAATDRTGQVFYVNPACARAIGQNREDIIGKSIKNLVTSNEYQAKLEEIIKDTLANGSWRGEMASISPDKPDKIMAWRTWSIQNEQAQPIGLCVAVTDITEQQKLETTFRQTQKEQSLQTLAGGIAHDLNNLLTAISGNADLGLLELPKDSSIREYLYEIRKAVDRAARLSEKMRTYSGNAHSTMKPLVLEDVIRDMEDIFSDSISTNILIRYKLAVNPFKILADPLQIRQLIMSIFTNAAEAIGDQAGTITISTRIATLCHEMPNMLQMGETLSPGQYLVLEIADTGCGMSADVREKIFDPFFTTKFIGRGLGLAETLGIIRCHHGDIHVTSQANKGSNFEIYLPCMIEN